MTTEDRARAEAEGTYPEPPLPDGWGVQSGKRAAFVAGAIWQAEQEPTEAENEAVARELCAIFGEHEPDYVTTAFTTTGSKTVLAWEFWTDEAEAVLLAAKETNR